MNAQVKFTRTFNVWKYIHNTKTWVGYVQADTHTQADKRAANLWGHGTWTTERD